MARSLSSRTSTRARVRAGSCGAVRSDARRWLARHSHRVHKSDMKTTLVLILAAASALAETDNFDDAKPGALPKGWSSAVTGSGNAKWTIEKDDTAPTKPNV